MEPGTVVKIKDNEMSRAHGFANEEGMVMCGDPKRVNGKKLNVPGVVAVQLFKKRGALCELGIHVSNLEEVKR